VSVPTIGRDELYEKLTSGEELVIVDALPPMSFAHSHLPGAINIPPERCDSAAKRLPDKSAAIVVYCANPECESSIETAERLRALGYTHVRHYPGGKTEWREAGLPLERAGAPYDPRESAAAS
jgi:rhodanese-related sulfurtransferase